MARISLRKLANTIEQFDIAVNEYPEIIKEDLEKNIQNIAILNTIMKEYLEELKICYEECKLDYEELSQMEKNGIIFKITKNIYLRKIRNSINNCEELIEYSQSLYQKTEKIKVRLKQFKYFS